MELLCRARFAKRLLAQLGMDDRENVRSAGGQGGALLLPPSQAGHLMPDDHFVVAICLRLRLLHAAHLGREGLEQAQQCGHRYVQTQTQCSCFLDSRGLHGQLCKVGGDRHDGIWN